MKAVIVGSGRVGCGFAAQLLAAAGYEITIIGRGSALQRIQRHGRIVVRLTNARESSSHIVPIAATVQMQDHHSATEAVQQADVVCTAVGPGALTEVGGFLSQGLARAAHPINVIAFENLEEAHQVLAGAVHAQIGPGAFRHGYTGAVVDRVMATRVIPADTNRPVCVIGEPGDSFAVAESGLAVPLAPIPGMQIVSDYRAHFRRKLFRYSAGHATAAYLGRLKGYRYLHAAIRDPEIHTQVRAAMREGQRGLKHRYGPDIAGDPRDLDVIIERFGNATLGDTVQRVGRDVPRKLGFGERLIGPARLAQDARQRPEALTGAVAAALLSTGESAADAPIRIAQLTGLSPDDRLTTMITGAWRRLSDSGSGPLLSLQEELWAMAAQVETMGQQMHTMGRRIDALQDADAADSKQVAP